MLLFSGKGVLFKRFFVLFPFSWSPARPVLDLPKTISCHLNEDDDVLAALYQIIRNSGKRKRPVGITKETLFKTRGWGL